MESTANSPWVVISERRSNGPFSSLAALFTQVGHKRLYSPYDRPPFPIIIDKPSVQDLVSSWRFSDYFMFATVYGAGTLAAFVFSRHHFMVAKRLLTYHYMSHMSFILACSLMVIVPFRRV